MEAIESDTEVNESIQAIISAGNKERGKQDKRRKMTAAASGMTRTGADTQFSEQSQDTPAEPKVKKLNCIIDSQVREQECVMSTNCSITKPKTSYKKILADCQGMMKVKEEMVEEMITSKRQKPWFPPRQAMKVSMLLHLFLTLYM